MSLANYSDLTSAVADYVQRTDLTGVIPTFVTLAEAMMNFGDAGQDIEPLRVREMEAVVTGITPTNGDITLAADFLEMKRVTDVGATRTTLTYVSPADLDAMYPTGNSNTGCPASYTVVGSTMSTRPISVGAEYVYYQKIPALSGSGTNWLMSKAPTAYLYASLFQEAIYNQNPQAGEAMLSLYRNAILGLERSDRANKAGQFVVRTSMPAW